MRKQHSLRFILNLATTSLLVLAILACALASILHYRSTETRREQERLARFARYLSEERVGPEALETFAEAFSLRITMIGEDGTVFFDNSFDTRELDNHLYRPEIREALATGSGSAIRKSANAGQQLLYEAIRTDSGSVVQVSRELSLVKGWTAEFLRDISVIFVLLMLLSSLIVLAIINRVTGALQVLTKTATEYGKGNFHHRSSIAGPKEYRILSESLLTMAKTVQTQIAQLKSTSFEYMAIFDAMEEGVVLIGRDGRIILSNSTFDTDFAHGGNAEDTPLWQWVFDRQVRDSVEAAFGGNAAEPCHLTVNPEGTGRRYYQVRMAPVSQQEKMITSLVVTFSDVTETRNLELVRKDFVSNVSHELKTPLTSIRGFSEILLSDQAGEAQREQFMRIIFDNVCQMQAIVEDLLLLASLESNERQRSFSPCPVGQIVKESIRRCSRKAEEKEIRIVGEVDDSLSCLGSEGLLVQALVNLLLNAILYSDRGKTVTVDAKMEGDLLRLRVADQGCGIEPENLKRIFERFYRVDKARSRKEGGTGLGLSIVKHIASVHGGSVTVESQVGVGSVFTLSLPQ